MVRARLAQAFGRLIRREGDRGHVRDPVGGDAVATAHGVPAGVPIRRVPLDEAIAHVGPRLVRARRSRLIGASAVKTPVRACGMPSRTGAISWLEDFDRPLNERGWNAAQRMGRRNARARISSSISSRRARRARATETLDGVEEGFGEKFETAETVASISPRLRHWSSCRGRAHERRTLADRRPQSRACTSLCSSSRRRSGELRDEVAHKFPTAALAEIELRRRAIGRTLRPAQAASGPS